MEILKAFEKKDGKNLLLILEQEVKKSVDKVDSYKLVNSVEDTTKTLESGEEVEKTELPTPSPRRKRIYKDTEPMTE